MKGQQKGTLFVFAAAVLYSIGGVCMKMIPWHGMSINAGRSFIAMFVVGTFMVLTKHKLRFNRWILVGALSVFLTNALFYPYKPWSYGIYNKVRALLFYI